MNTKTISQKYFLDNLPEQAKNLFYKDPKQFKTLYRNKLVSVVKQDILQMVQFVTPVYEIVHHSDWYDSWHTEHYWYNIKREYKQESMNLFKIYCSSGCPGSFSDVTDENKFKFETKDKKFFDLLRAVYFYINYRDRKKWKMSDITPLNIFNNRDVDLIYSDFVASNYNPKTKKTSLKIKKTKTELGKEIEQECEKITDRLIDKEIKRISNINEQIKQAKETLAKYGTEPVRGY